MDEEETRENENEEVNEEAPNQSKTKENPFSPSLGIPSKFDIFQFLKALQILLDKGGSAEVKELNPLFGETARLQEFHGRALKFADKLGYVSFSGRRYTLTDEGKKFIPLDEDGKKDDLKGKLLSYKGYEDIFIALKNSKDKSKKKEEITNLWIKYGGKKAIRSLMTKTFASMCNWCNIIEDSGKTCSYLLNNETISSPESLPEKKVQENSPQPIPEASVQLSSDSGVACPRCKSNNIGLTDEEIQKFIEGETQTIVFKQLKYFCRNCQQPFTRVSKELI